MCIVHFNFLKIGFVIYREDFSLLFLKLLKEKKDWSKMSEGRVTEITHLPIQHGVDVDTTMQKISSLCANVPGMLSWYWGIQVEHPDMLDLVAGTPHLPS
jgi:hypothetical protein